MTERVLDYYPVEQEKNEQKSENRQRWEYAIKRTAVLLLTGFGLSLGTRLIEREAYLLTHGCPTSTQERAARIIGQSNLESFLKTSLAKNIHSVSGYIYEDETNNFYINLSIVGLGVITIPRLLVRKPKFDKKD